MQGSARALVGAMLLVPVLGACGSAGSPPAGGQPAAPVPVGGAGFVGPQWSLTAAAVDSSNLSDFAITIRFDDATAAGRAGVNSYNGTYTSSPDGAMSFGPIASTRMAGPADAMAAEAAYLAVLATVTGYTVADGELDLFAGQQEVLAYAAPQEVGAAPDASAEGGLTTCDESTLRGTLSDHLAQEDAKVDSFDGLACADGWALVQATVSTPDGPADGDRYVFEAEGSSWNLKEVSDVCGSLDAGSAEAPADALIPGGLWVRACTTG
jgi:heat shock protein HslJ